MSGQSTSSPTYLLLARVLRVYQDFHLAYVVFCGRDLVVQTFFMSDNTNDLYTDLFHLDRLDYFHP